MLSRTLGAYARAARLRFHVGNGPIDQIPLSLRVKTVTDDPLDNGDHNVGHLLAQLFGSAASFGLDIGAGPGNDALILPIGLLTSGGAQLVSHAVGVVHERTSLAPGLIDHSGVF